MSIKVHHGPPGSYKTSGAVQDDFVRWAKEGRTIVTNVRGLTQRHIDDTHPEWECEIISVDTDTVAGRDRLSRWYQWVPTGAFLLIDEAQRIFPKRWREKDLAALDEGYQPDVSERPTDWLDAWTRHRHFNWDMVLTTPNVRLIRDDILECSEMLYAHKNMAVLGDLPGFKGAYMEAMHAPGTTSKTPIAARRRTIQKQTWGLYESTATGNIADTTAGQSIFKNPKMLVLLGTLAVATVFLGRSVVGGDHFLFDGAQAAVEPIDPVTPAPGSTAETARTVSRHTLEPSQTGDMGAYLTLLDGHSLKLKGAIKRVKDGEWFHLFEVTGEQGRFELTGGELEALGYTVEGLGVCAVKIHGGPTPVTVLCKGREVKQAGIGL
jgi:zona occludens toxin